MSEVLPSIIRAVAQVLGDADLDVTGAARGLPGVAAAMRGGNHRVPWSEYVTLVERATEGLSDLELEIIGERYAGAVSQIRVFAQLAISPSALLSFTLRTLPIAWPHLRFSYAWSSAERAVLRCEIPEPYAASRAYLRASVGTYRALPRLVGTADARVAYEVDDRRATYEVEVPASRTLLARGLRAIDPREAAGLLEVLLDLPRHPQPSVGEVPDDHRLQREWGLTPTEARVARRLAAGMRLEEVARDLGVSKETTRTHLKQVFGKTGTRRQVALVALLRGLPLRE